VRDRFADRHVQRNVQGVSMVLPWSHRLPDYAAANPAYGQNLVELARLLATPEAPLTVLDIGANVGDSALQILHATDARVMCVEGDRAYLDFLRLNVGDDPRVTIVEGLLAVGEDETSGTAVRSGGTTRFVHGDGGGDAMPTVTTTALRDAHPAFDDLRLVKSDTDGYDTSLVPAVAAAWKEARPVLFFEYDPELTRIAGHEPAQVWTDLAALGYRDVAVWDNGAQPLGRATTSEIQSRTAPLDAPGRAWSQARTYWDVAVVHEHDAAGITAIDALVPSSLTL
jgi:FkbM family methyltransferase